MSNQFPTSQKCRNIVRRFLVGIMAVHLLAPPLWACQVPVFRYALERWKADKYQVVVLYEQPLNDACKSALEKLRDASKPQDSSSSSIELSIVDFGSGEEASDTHAKWRRIWDSRNDSSSPLMLVYYPRANRVGQYGPMYEAPLCDAQVERLLSSPLRTKLTKRLEAGDSAVWIFVPSGNEESDSVALSKLRQQTNADAKWLELPTADELEVDEKVLSTTKIPLKMQFSILTLNRDDEAEKFLLQSLLRSEADLMDFDNEPLAFPVFGQGRVLYALVGKGIASDTIRTASSFMAGPCSCQVKNQNPGFDLLLRADWKSVLGDVLISDPIESSDQESVAPKLLTIPPGRAKR